jgi:hypothetical protein
MKNKSLQGMSLIEILVSLFLLSLIQLGAVEMQCLALREDYDAWIFMIATVQLNNITERLHTDFLLDNQIKQWNQENEKVLPQGIGKVTGDYPEYTVTLYWGNPRLPYCKENQLATIGCLQEKIII